MNHLITAACLFVLCNFALADQGIVTLTAQAPGGSNEVQISASQNFKFVSGFDNCGNAEVLVIKDSKSFHYQPTSAYGTVAGPTTVRLITSPTAGPTCLGMLTLDIQPAAFPPDKTATVGAYSGNVQVIMEISTDLVNWTTATNSVVYTNSPDARFFRIKLITNATP